MLIPFRVVIQNILASKQNKNLKKTSIETYTRRLRLIEKWFADRGFETLPNVPDPYYDFLNTFKVDKETGATGRYKRNLFDYLKILTTAAERLGFTKNFLADNGFERPLASHRPIRTCSLEQVAAVNKTPENDREMVIWQLLGGMGWRQVESTRILAGDVRRCENNSILVHGKEREEYTPILPETLTLLKNMTFDSLSDNDEVIRSQHKMNGVYEPLKDNGLYNLVKGLSAGLGLTTKGTISSVLSLHSFDVQQIKMRPWQ